MATTNPKGPYSRVYLSVMSDPAFAGIFDDDAALATWLRLLLLADHFWPIPAPMPSKATRGLKKLLEAGLVIPSGTGLTIRGLEAERERRSAYGRNAAAMRWQSASNAGAMPEHQVSNADPMPSTSTRRVRDETSSASNADAMRTHTNGAPTPRPSRPLKPGEHQGQHPDCLVCHAMHAKPWEGCLACQAERALTSRTTTAEKEPL